MSALGENSARSVATVFDTNVEKVQHCSNTGLYFFSTRRDPVSFSRLSRFDQVRDVARHRILIRGGSLDQARCFEVPESRGHIRVKLVVRLSVIMFTTSQVKLSPDRWTPGSSLNSDSSGWAKGKATQPNQTWLECHQVG